MRRLVLPTISGVLYFLSWIGFGIWPLAFVCFLPLLWSLREARPKQAFLRGWWMGFVTHLGGYTWIMHTLRVFAYAPWPLAFLGYLLPCAAPHLAIGIAQPNVGEIELHANPDASVRTLQDETAELYAKHADLVVWPEVGFNTRAVRWNEPRALDIRGGVPMPRIAGVIRV